MRSAGTRGRRRGRRRGRGSRRRRRRRRRERRGQLRRQKNKQGTVQCVSHQVAQHGPHLSVGGEQEGRQARVGQHQLLWAEEETRAAALVPSDAAVQGAASKSCKKTANVATWPPKYQGRRVNIWAALLFWLGEQVPRERGERVGRLPREREFACRSGSRIQQPVGRAAAYTRRRAGEVERSWQNGGGKLEQTWPGFVPRKVAEGRKRTWKRIIPASLSSQ